MHLTFFGLSDLAPRLRLLQFSRLRLSPIRVRKLSWTGAAGPDCSVIPAAADAAACGLLMLLLLLLLLMLLLLLLRMLQTPADAANTGSALTTGSDTAADS